MSDLLDKIRAAQRDAGERVVMDDLQKKLGGHPHDALKDLSSASPPPTTGGDTLLQRLRAYRGAVWETTECYNGLREEAALQIETLREALRMVADADDDCHRDGLQTIPAAARAAIDRALGKEGSSRG